LLAEHTKSAKLLGKRVQKLIADMDNLVKKLETEKTSSPTQPSAALSSDK
jgi:hypothetical protein